VITGFQSGVSTVVALEVGDGIEGSGDLIEMSTGRWLIDGMNVIGSRPNGWWRDRRGAIQRFTERVAEFVALSGDSATVVFDGKPFSMPAEVGVVFAPGGRNAADDAIVGIVSDDREPSAVTVVTSDRELSHRVQARGAETLAASAFLRHLEEIA
jgi:predicted RNA-binding protein with PIN domain